METQRQSGAGDGWPFVERRVRPDRRLASTRPWSALFGPRRRRGGRRRGEQQNLYVDRYEPRDVALVVCVFALNLADAVYTLFHLAHGGSEANPVHAILLSIGTHWFVAEKIVVVGALLLLLTVHKTYRLALAGLWSLAAVYACLLGYHVVLHAWNRGWV
jgi:hypothetical protein